MEAKRTYDLEERLIEFAVMIANIVQEIRRTRIGNYVAGQITRSGFSPAFNYGEAQAGESRQDFIHKLKIVLKELREEHSNSSKQQSFMAVAPRKRFYIHHSIFIILCYA